VDIGAAHYQIATAVKGVLAQRLVRRLCVSCAGAGCRECGGTGYRGRRAIAEILIASPEFERRVASSATPESIADAARANGCIPLWDAGLALVRRGETSIDELRRVAAEPARRVTEPAITEPCADPAPTRIGWWSARAGAVSNAVRGQMDAAAAALGGDVRIVSVGDGESPEPLDAVIVVGASSSMPNERVGRGERAGVPWRPEQARAPLVLALALDGATGEHVRLLGRDADVVLSATTHGRVILATVLALLRWRGR
jgi:hypothetical protein